VAAADGGVDILMVEDNPDDEQLTLRAFAKNHLTNKIHVVRDGQEALDYVFSRASTPTGISPIIRTSSCSTSSCR